jgi:diguanylate cyclase (GGDEF)-like protein/PAS domain S-box-containing protein
MSRHLHLRRRAPAGVTIGLAIVLLGVVFGVRLWVADPAEPILFLSVIPVALIAAEAGIVGGVTAAAAASTLVIAWDLIEDPRLSWIGFAARFLVFFLTGSAVGFLTSARRELEAETTRWFDNSTDLNCVADFEGNFVRLNRAFETTLGYDMRDLLATPYVAHVHPDDRKETNEVAAALAAGRSHLVDFENRYRATDGTYRWFRWTATSDAERKLIYASARDVTTMKALQSELLERAQTDSLTGLFNRRHFEEEAERQLDFLQRYGYGGAVFLLDVDDFKKVNDELGHAAGDDAIRAVGDAISARIRKSDTAGRIGGDEFAILFPGVGEEDAGMLAAEILEEVRGRPLAGRRLACSVGVALFEAGAAPDLAGLLETADRAMYTAKQAGGDRSDMTVTARNPSSAP